MSIHPAFLGHGIFTEYGIDNALNRYAEFGNGPPATKPVEKIARLIETLGSMDIQNVWIQLFSRKSRFDMDTTHAKLRKDLLKALDGANIKWAGWGYCAGSNATRDLGWIKNFKDDLGMEAFVIDAEPEENKHKDIWTNAVFENFLEELSKSFGVDNLALSTWPCVQLREPSVRALMKLAEPHVCLFAPQIYWMDYPTLIHYQTLGYAMSEFPPHDPVSFVRMMIKAWQDAGFIKPLVISGQAYWEQGTPKMSMMGFKVKQFAMHFDNWEGILGFNWYHAGKAVNSEENGSMSDAMIGFIRDAQLGHKPYGQLPTDISYQISPSS